VFLAQTGRPSCGRSSYRDNGRAAARNDLGPFRSIRGRRPPDGLGQASTVTHSRVRRAGFEPSRNRAPLAPTAKEDPYPHRQGGLGQSRRAGCRARESLDRAWGPHPVVASSHRESPSRPRRPRDRHHRPLFTPSCIPEPNRATVTFVANLPSRSREPPNGRPEPFYPFALRRGYNSNSDTRGTPSRRDVPVDVSTTSTLAGQQSWLQTAGHLRIDERESAVSGQDVHVAFVVSGVSSFQRTPCRARRGAVRGVGMASMPELRPCSDQPVHPRLPGPAAWKILPRFKGR